MKRKSPKYSSLTEDFEEELDKKAVILGEVNGAVVTGDDDGGLERFGVEKSCFANGEDFVAEEGGGNDNPAEKGLDSSVTTWELVSYLCKGNLKQKTMERFPAFVIRASTV